MLETNLTRRAQAYNLLWMCYCADGAIYGRTPEGVARWAYLQALPHVSPATALEIARRVREAAETLAVPITPSVPGSHFLTVESFQAFFN